MDKVSWLQNSSWYFEPGLAAVFMGGEAEKEILDRRNNTSNSTEEGERCNYKT